MDARIRERRYPHWKDLCETFGIRERQAKEDIRHLRQRIGAPLVFHSARRGYYYTEPTYRLPYLALTETEANTLRQSLLAAQSYLPPTDAALVRQLAVRLSPYLRDLPRHDDFASDGQEILTGRIRLADEFLIPEELLRDIRHALEQRRRLDITYFGAHRGEITERIVRPYTLLNWRGELYLIAFCERRTDLRHFFLPRIRHWRLLPDDETFTVPPDFDIRSYLETAFQLQRGGNPVSVRLRFSARQAVWIRERRYHATQHNHEQDDGGLIITLHVALTEDLTRWILGYGAEVEVMEPAELRQTIRQELHRLKTIYNEF
ncbi:MAG: WYL domain-containing protein [Capsulimonadales bacterium]|nr:WYL domain-containing protein [Capsulimonadales bacterium]